MEREWVAEESIIIDAEPTAVYAAVSEPRRMTEWSPELFAVWVRGKQVKEGTRFVGFNRRRWWVWFTTCRVSARVPNQVFAFRVSAFGMPVALWGYRVESIDPAKTRLTEYWEDLRRDNRRVWLLAVVGLVFTGVPPAGRAALNRAGMRTTLTKIKAALE